MQWRPVPFNDEILLLNALPRGDKVLKPVASGKSSVIQIGELCGCPIDLTSFFARPDNPDFIPKGFEFLPMAKMITPLLKFKALD